MEPLRPGRMSAPGKTEPTDVIARARTGDTQAWGELYREFAPAIFRFCRRAMPTREDAEDATMEIFMKLRDKLIQYDQTRSFTAWLYKVAANHCWDMLRRRKARHDKDMDDVDDVALECPEPNQLEKLIEERTSEEVRKALDTLALRAIDRESRLLTRSMLEQDEPLPARLSEFHEKVKRNMQWIWGVIFGLTVLGVYALYTGYILPWESQFEQAGFGSTNLLNLVVFQGAFWKGWQSMFSLFEVLAVASMPGFGLFAFPPCLRRGSALAVLFTGS